MAAPNQYGFRGHHQASEVIFSILQIRETSREWARWFGVLKLDVTKAFDRLDHAAILEHLQRSPLTPTLAYLLGRELFGVSLIFGAFGVQSEPTRQQRGVK